MTEVAAEPIEVNRIAAPTASLSRDDSPSRPSSAAPLVVPAGDPAPAALPPEKRAFTRTGLPFNGAQVNKVSADLPEAHRIAVRWLFDHGRSRGDTLKSLAQRIRISDNTLYRIFKGEYGAGLDNFSAKVEAYRKIDEERSKVGRPVFIPTEVSRLIWERCSDALNFQRVAPIIGDFQIGKTFALTAYRDHHNHGQTKYCRLPAGSGYRVALEELAKSLNVSHTGPLCVLRNGIFGALDSRHLLIIDEADEPLAGRFNLHALETYNTIREIFDRRECGLVLCGNHKFLEGLTGQGPLAAWMGKLKRRCIPPLVLPSVPPDADLWALADYYGLGMPEEQSEEWKTARAIAANDGIGQYSICLQAGAKAAKTLGVEPAWGHFLKAIERFAGKEAA